MSTTNILPRSSSLPKRLVSGRSMFAFALGGLALSLSLCSTGSAQEGWTAADVTLTADGVLGVTDGPTALHLNGLTSGFKNDVGWSGNIVSGAVFGVLNEVGTALQGGATDLKLEFDLAKDTSLTTNGWAQLSMFINSTTGVGIGGWKEYSTGQFLGGNSNTTFPIPQGNALTDGVTVANTGTDQYHVAVPLGLTGTMLGIGPGTFFQIGFKSSGGWTGTMDLAFDDMRITGLAEDKQLYSWATDPVFTEETLFSWETADVGGTPVNEQYEGWTEVDLGGHVHSLTATGATDGNWALQIDRQSQTSPNFTWGSHYAIASRDLIPADDPADFDEDGDRDGGDFLAWQVGFGTMGTAVHGDGDATGEGDVTAADLAIWESAFGVPVPIDPAIQDDIDELAAKINAAHSIAFDVRFDDSAPNSPTYTKFGLAISDDSETWYEAEGSSFYGIQPIGTTGTVTIPLSTLLDGGTGQTLDVAGLAAGTEYIGITISTNTDGAGIYQIDNFRLITEVPPSVASAQTAVPEPSAWMLALLGCTIMLRRGRQG